MNLYTYCANNPIVNIDPDGHFWNVVIGAGIGAAIGAVTSVVTQGITKGFDNIDVKEVLLDAGAGAISGGLAATGVGLAGQVFGNQIIGGVSSVIKDGYISKRDGKKFGAYEIMKSAGNGILAGTAAGLLGGSESASKHTSGHFGRLISKLGNSKSDAVKGITNLFKGNSSVAKNLLSKAGKTASNGIKYYFSQTTKDSIKTATSFGTVKAIAKSTLPAWKDSVLKIIRKNA